jgi:hypothetical protein
VTIFGAVATLEPRTLAVLREAESPDDAAELIKERRLEVVDLDEHWHALHWLLARRATPIDSEPITWAILGRTLLPRLDRGRGAPGFVDADEARLVADALANLGPKTARLRFDAGAMDSSGIYPQTWGLGGTARPHELLSYLKPLSSLYRRAARSAAGVIGYRY